MAFFGVAILPQALIYPTHRSRSCWVILLLGNACIGIGLAGASASSAGYVALRLVFLRLLCYPLLLMAVISAELVSPFLPNRS